MPEILKVNQADILIAIRNRIIQRIPECNMENTHFDDDPTAFESNQYPAEKHFVLITPMGGTKIDQASAHICDVRENSSVAIGLYWKSTYSQPMKYIDDVMVTGEKSFIRYWKPAILDAMTVNRQDSTQYWMPQDEGGRQMLTEPMQLTNFVDPRRGQGWDVFMQAVFSLNFIWDLRA